MKKKKKKEKRKIIERKIIVDNKELIIDSKEHYYNYYDSETRFIGYFNQIRLIKNIKGAKKVLEIGVGNKTVSNYLKHIGYKVTTIDINRELKPDYVMDIQDIDKSNFKENEFDIVLCSKVLEYVPFKKTERILKELYRISKSAVLSMPYNSLTFSFHFKMPFLRRKDFLFAFPLFIKSKKYYWELGEKGYSVGKFRDILRSIGFEIIKEGQVPLYPRQYDFLLKKK